MRRSELLRALVAELPPIVFEEYGRKDTCIPAAYHAYEVLRARGCPARLATMNAVAMNTAFAEWVTGNPYDPMPPWAWSVGITEQNPSNEGPQDFLSHLVVRSKGKIIDCAAGGMSRPKRDMPVPPGLLVTGGAWDSETTIVSYQPSSEPVPPMWVLDPQATARVRERINQAIEARKD